MLSLPAISGVEEARAVLAGLGALGSVRERVCKVERLSRFVREIHGYRDARQVRDLLTAEGGIHAETARSLDEDLQTGPGLSADFSQDPAMPLFSIGGVSFRQSSFVEIPLVAGEGLVPEQGEKYQFGITHGRFLVPNEPGVVGAVSAAIGGVGGTYVGVGSVQNFSLATVAEATGLILIDRDPAVAMMNSLILSNLPGLKTPRELRARLEGIGLPAGMTPGHLLCEVPSHYQRGFADLLRDIEWCQRQEEDRFLTRYLQAWERFPRSILTDEDAFGHLAGLVEKGRVAVVYGNLFGVEMPDLIGAALEVFPDPVRVVYTANAPDWLTRSPTRILPAGSSPAYFLQILHASWADPEGIFLATTGREPHWRYLSVPIGRGATLLAEEKGEVSRWIDRLRQPAG